MRNKTKICIVFFLYIGLFGLQAQTVKDIDSNEYKTVTIGTQVWIAENLNTTKYNDGTAIPNITDNTEWAALSTGAYCDYNNAPTNSITYGRLYNWYTVNTGKLCPTGWHVPSNSEWETTVAFLRGNDQSSKINGGDNLVGYKLKESGTAHWINQNPLTTNESGFTFLPAGSRSSSIQNTKGEFKNLGNFGYMWSSTEMNERIGCFFGLYNHNGVVGNGNAGDAKTLGISVRCLQD